MHWIANILNDMHCVKTRFSFDNPGLFCPCPNIVLNVSSMLMVNPVYSRYRFAKVCPIYLFLFNIRPHPLARRSRAEHIIVQVNLSLQTYARTVYGRMLDYVRVGVGVDLANLGVPACVLDNVRTARARVNCTGRIWRGRFVVHGVGTTWHAIPAHSRKLKWKTLQ